MLARRSQFLFGSMMIGCLGIAGGLGSSCFLPNVALAQKREPREPIREITLRLADQAEVQRIELAGTSAARTDRQRVAVTDLIVKLKSLDAQPIAAALGQPNASAPAKPMRALFGVDLMLVTEGRIRIEDGARCAPWRADVAICQAACEGGAFALVRRVDNGAPSLRLVVGDFPGGEVQEMTVGVRLAQCRESVGLEWALEPVGGTRQATLLLRVE